MKIKLLTLSVVAFMLASSLMAQATYNANTDFFIDSLVNPSGGLSLTSSGSTIDLTGGDGAGDAFFYFDNGQLDLTGVLENGLTLDFTPGTGHAASSSFVLQLANYGDRDGSEWYLDITGLSWGDSSAGSTAYSSTDGVDLSKVDGFGIYMGGNPSDPVTVNAQISSISVVPEPSTYALIAGFAAFLFVAIRRRK